MVCVGPSRSGVVAAVSCVPPLCIVIQIVSDVRRIVSDVRRIVSDARRIVADAGRIVTDARRIVADARRIVADARRVVPAADGWCRQRMAGAGGRRVVPAAAAESNRLSPSARPDSATVTRSSAGDPPM